MDRKRLTWGGWLLLLLFFLSASLHALSALLSDTDLLWHGVAARGVIVNAQTTGCWKLSTTTSFSVQFTVPVGQAYTSTISQCDYSGFKASHGESVSIVYRQNDPTTIAPADPADGLLAKVRFDWMLTIPCGLITLSILLFLIRELIRRSKLQRQERQAAAERWRAMGERLSNAHGTDQE